MAQSILIDRRHQIVEHVLSRKGPCRAATTGPVTLSGLQTVDGVALVDDDRVLVKDQTNQVENGLWLVKGSDWQRARDFAHGDDVRRGAKVFVVGGTVNALTDWYVASDDGTFPGREALAFAQLISGANAAAIAALTPADGSFIVGNGATWVAESGDTARTSLGLGSTAAPQFSSVSVSSGLNIGSTDTTVARTGAGDIAVAGNALYRAGGTDIPVADGGTGRSAATPYAVLCGGTTDSTPHQSVASVGSSGHVLTSNGAGALPSFQAPVGGSGTAASTAEMAAATSRSVFVTPGLQQYHPLQPKAWVVAGSSGTVLEASSTSASVSSTATGILVVTWGVTFATTTYPTFGTADSTGGILYLACTEKTTVAATFQSRTGLTTLTYPTRWNLFAFGSLSS